MTSDAEQKILNTAYSSIPPVKTAQEDTAFNTPANAVLKDTLAKSAAALPQVADESQFETAVGTAVKDLFADAAAGRAVTTASVKAELQKAQQQMLRRSESTVTSTVTPEAAVRKDSSATAAPARAAAVPTGSAASDCRTCSSCPR